MTTVMDGHIVVDEKGVARVQGSKIKVMNLVAEMRCNGLTAEQLHQGYPHLQLSHIYAALAYYLDHREQIDAQIEESSRSFDELRKNHKNPLTREELERRKAERGLQ
jgi:uncharacterized protein (DUF433 family)